MYLGHAAFEALDGIRDEAFAESCDGLEDAALPACLPGAARYAGVWTPVDFARGAFCEIDASRIDLPAIPACPSKNWINLLPVDLKPLFLTPEGGLLGQFLEKVKNGLTDLPPPRVSAIAGHFSKIV